MSSPIEITCPSCDEPLKIPSAVLGKKIKCKHCDHAFVVKDPGTKVLTKSAKPAKPAKLTKPAKTEAKAAPVPPPPPPEVKKPLWDDEDAKDVSLIAEEDVPRCPHCAKELDPPDAIVCLHCGFNSRTRARAETKKVWAPEFMDWFMHLLPGIIALAIAIGLLTFIGISIANMRDWLTDTILESDEKDASGRKKFYVPPGAFILFIMFLSLPILIPSIKFAFRRLAVEYKPTEQIKK
jgi:hypothetical protein